jgi:mono/diheme cytochrome c family protein
MMRRLLAWCGLAAIGGGLAYTCLTPGVAPVLVQTNQPPRLVVTPVTQSVGVVPTDSKVTARYLLSNLGGKPLHIQQVDTSCGCTATALSKTMLRGGESTPLAVTLDTSIKLGHVVKTITIQSNDPQHPATPITLTGEVIFKMQGHERIAVKDPLVLFKGQCASCHVKQGLGKTGKALFMADCAMCHGSRGQGGVGPGLMQHNWQQPAIAKAMRQVIAMGSAKSPEMPPYHQSKGGPLTDAEIDSLITYLTYEHGEQQAEKIKETAN